MKSYEVTIYYEGCLRSYVEANSEDEAIEIAQRRFNQRENSEAIVNNAEIAECDADEYGEESKMRNTYSFHYDSGHVGFVFPGGTLTSLE